MQARVLEAPARGLVRYQILPRRRILAERALDRLPLAFLQVREIETDTVPPRAPPHTDDTLRARGGALSALLLALALDTPV